MFSLSLPLFRILLIGKELRRLVFGLLAAVPNVLSLFFMLGVRSPFAAYVALLSVTVLPVNLDCGITSAISPLFAAGHVRVRYCWPVDVCRHIFGAPHC